MISSIFSRCQLLFLSGVLYYSGQRAYCRIMDDYYVFACTSCGVALNTSSGRPRALTFYLDIDCGTIIAEDGDGLEFMNARDDVGAIRAILMLDAGLL